MLIQYLEQLYKEFSDNRKRLNAKWKSNKAAYDGATGEATDQDKGMGNKGDPSEAWRSKTVLNMTRTKVHAGEVLVNDVIFSGGDFPFTLRDYKFLPDGREKDEVVMPDRELVPPEYDGLDVQTIFNIEKQKTVERIRDAYTAGELSEEEARQAVEQTMSLQLPPRPKTSAEMMEALIREQQDKSDAKSALKMCVHSAAIYGDGIGKLYLKKFKRSGFVQDKATGAWNMEGESYSAPAVKNVSVFNFFTDLESRDIQHNSGCFERMYASKGDILAMFRGDEDVIRSEFDKFNETHESVETFSGSAQYKDDDSPELRMIERRRKTIEIIEFWGRVPEKIAVQFEKSINAFEESGQEIDDRDIEIMAVFCEGHILKYRRTNDAMRPFFRISWEEPLDDIASRSICDIIDTMQQSINSAMRLLEDNKKLSSNVMFGRKQRYLANKNESQKLYPGKIIDVTEECDDVRKAIQPFVVPDVSQNLFDLISLYRVNANDQSMIPDIAHGVAADTRTTAYEISLQNEKAGKYISNIVKNIDSNAIEPIIRFCYEWNMLDPNVTNELKGAYDVKPLGYTSYQDKTMKLNKIMQVLNLCMGNELLMQFVNVKSLLRDAIKANEADPELYMTDDPNINTMQDIKFQQFQQAVAQQIEAQQKQIGDIMAQLPSISEKSQADAAVAAAKAQKLIADAKRTEADIEFLQNKMADNRAKTIAAVSEKAQRMDNDATKALAEAQAIQQQGNEVPAEEIGYDAPPPPKDVTGIYT